MKYYEQGQNEIPVSLIGKTASISNRGDMSDFISNGLKQYIKFDHSFILRYDKIKRTFRTYIYRVEEGKLNNPDLKKLLYTEYPVGENSFPVNNKPQLQDVDLCLSDGDRWIAAMHKAGIKEFVFLNLIVGNERIGFLVLMSEQRNTFSRKTLDLLQKVSHAMSVATFKIFVNEDGDRKEEDEKNLLLSLSNEIEALKTREGLFRVVNEKIKRLLNIKDFGFSSIDECGKTFKAFVMDIGEEIRSHPDYQKTIDSSFDVSDPLFTEVMDSKDPVIYIVDELAKRPNMPPYVDFWIKSGIRKVIIIPLRAGGNAIGTAIFIPDSDTEIDVKSTLLKGICAQLAVAISNILANEKIKEREKEKTRLLEFSNAMASVRDKQVLAKILKQQLMELFGIEDYVIHALSRDKKTHRPVLFDPDADFAQHPDFQKLIHTDTSVEDGVFNKILASEEIVAFNANEWINSPDPPTYSNAAKAIDLQRMGGISIRLGNEAVAVMNFRMEGIDNFAIKRPLFKSICSQLAIAISNIMANDKINRQLIEIENYKQQLEEEKIYLKEEIETTHNYSEIIGGSPEIKKVIHLVSKVAGSDTTVLLSGETGTGKELIARAVHKASPRRDKLMIKVNCAALPASLIESELFGHERGSFTGAFERRVGKFELANKSTLFLDEIGEMPLELQVKLLRALQEKEIERVGGTTTIKTDVRVIAATNRNLEKMMEEGKFRSDLYYRLNIFPIQIPPLRKRPEDIQLLTSHFIMRYSKKEGKKITNISSRVLNELKNYSWPGNIRELEHWVERSVLLAPGNTIKDAQLPIRNSKPETDEKDFKIQTIYENEKEYILKVLNHVNGKVSGEGGAADLLGVPPSTLNSRIKKLGIRREHHG